MKKIVRVVVATAAVMTMLALAPAADAARPGGGGGGGGGGQQTTTVRWGPLTIPAAQNGEMGNFENVIVKEGGCSWLTGYFADCLDMAVDPPCTDCYITSVTPNLVDSNTGQVINYNTMGMLHHVVNLDFSQPDPSCRPSWFGDSINTLGAAEGGNERWFASGNERTVFTMPPGYGYYVPRNAEWGFIADLMNMMPMERQWSFEYTFTWVRKGLEPVQPLWLDIDNCADSEVDLPLGYSDTHWDWRSNLTGSIVGIGGHVHDQGIAVAAENVSTGQDICTSVAGYAPGGVGEPAGPGTGADALHPADWVHQTEDANPFVPLAGFNGHISSHTTCDPFTPISSGNTIRLHATYNHDTMSHGDMGIMIAYIDEQ